MADQHADYDSKYGSYYDEHDRDDNSGVRYKAAMKKIALIVLRKLTDRQKSVYTRFSVDMKSAAEIAAEDGINISAVYRHLTKAETNIFKQSEFALLDSGIEMMFCDFKKTFMNLCPTLRRFVIDYYITGMQLQDIANKHGITRGEAKSRISDVTSYFKCNGFASDDLITIGKILSQGGES